MRLTTRVEGEGVGNRCLKTRTGIDRIRSHWVGCGNELAGELLSTIRVPGRADIGTFDLFDDRRLTHLITAIQLQRIPIGPSLGPLFGVDDRKPLLTHLN